MAIQQRLRDWVIRQSPEQASWLDSQLSRLADGAGERELHIYLGSVPRRLGKADLRLLPSDVAEAHERLPGWAPARWSVDGSARIAGLLAFEGARPSARPFAQVFADLARTADARELIALYQGLALYPRAELLGDQAGEGLRSNMRAVFEAIAHANPFPARHFATPRWNHMVLKALFVGSRLAPIVGLDERVNPELARILVDYAKERWAAGRPVSPELWRCVGPHVADIDAYAALERALAGSHAERAAAGLALARSDTPAARALLATSPDTRSLIDAGRLGWHNLPAFEAA